MTSHHLMHLSAKLANMQKINPFLTCVMDKDHSLYGWKDGAFSFLRWIDYDGGCEISDEAKHLTLFLRLYVVNGPGKRFYGDYLIEGMINTFDMAVICSALDKQDMQGFDPQDFGLTPIPLKNPYARQCLKHHKLAEICLVSGLDEAKNSLSLHDFIGHCLKILKNEQTI